MITASSMRLRARTCISSLSFPSLDFFFYFLPLNSNNSATANLFLSIPQRRLEKEFRISDLLLSPSNFFLVFSLATDHGCNTTLPAHRSLYAAFWLIAWLRLLYFSFFPSFLLSWLINERLAISLPSCLLCKDQSRSCQKYCLVYKIRVEICFHGCGGNFACLRYLKLEKERGWNTAKTDFGDSEEMKEIETLFLLILQDGKGEFEETEKGGSRTRE